MKRTRVIKIDSSLSDEMLAKALRSAFSIARHDLNKKLKQHLSKRDRDYCNQQDSLFLQLGASVEEPRENTYVMYEVSTAHITESDSTILSNMCTMNTNRWPSEVPIAPFNVGDTGFGYFLTLVVDPENDEDLDLGIIQKECEDLDHELSDSFWEILRFAKSQGYRGVYFDRDVEAVDNFKVYNW